MFEDDELEEDIEKLKKKPKSRILVPDKRKLRNLRQYRDMTDEEFDLAFEQKKLGATQSVEFEARIQKKIAEFGKDYDLEDLNSNDLIVLRALAQSMITLEDLELESYNTRVGGLNIDNIMVFEKLEKAKDGIRDQISKQQTDLGITRKVRKSDKDQSALLYMEDLKKKAKEFYEAKMQLIFCPKCGTWIGSIWTLFPGEERNKISLVCEKEMDDGTKCGEKITIGTKELLKTGSNKQDIPETIK